MESILYKVIKTEKRYYEYCDKLEELVTLKKKTRQQQDAIELLILLIENWYDDHNTFEDSDPIELLKYLMAENKIKAVELAKLFGIVKVWYPTCFPYECSFKRCQRNEYP
jgi:HTH-type transcriptional regulator/antitoxin HigA